MKRESINRINCIIRMSNDLFNKLNNNEKLNLKKEELDFITSFLNFYYCYRRDNDFNIDTPFFEYEKLLNELLKCVPNDSNFLLCDYINKCICEKNMSLLYDDIFRLQIIKGIQIDYDL